MPDESPHLLYQLLEESRVNPAVATQLKAILRDSIKEVLSETNCVVCPIPGEARTEIGHLTGMIRDIGSGDISRGIEVMRDNSRVVKKWARLEQRVGGWVLKSVVLFMMAVLLGATVVGLIGHKLPIGK